MGRRCGYLDYVCPEQHVRCRSQSRYVQLLVLLLPTISIKQLENSEILQGIQFGVRPAPLSGNSEAIRNSRIKHFANNLTTGDNKQIQVEISDQPLLNT